MAIQEVDKNLNELNRELRLIASPYLIKKVIIYMKKEKIRKRSDFLYKAVCKLIGE